MNSDAYSKAARTWATSDGEARRLEAMKEPTLWRLAKVFMTDAEQRGVTVTITAAEREVKASEAWETFINGVGAARTQANLDRAEMDTLIMKHEEQHGPSRVRAA